MTGTVVDPLKVTATVDMSTGRTPTMSHMNPFHISSVVDRLLAHVRGGSRNDSNEFFKLCISLSRAIDYAVLNKELPVKAPELRGLLKQVCQWKNDAPFQAVIMVLLISVKGACRNGWFNEKDNEELQNLSNEIASSFCSVQDMNFGENTFHHSISAVMLRFYPCMKMVETHAFVEATLGYGAFVKDFDITAKSMCSNDKIYLFVAQIDDTETSSCIISPQQVNFLLNGRAVDGRTCVSKEPCPQTPTPITHMLKLGTNLLQVVGQFNGKYIIVVASMSMVSTPICPILPNYIPPTAATPDSDNDLIEGPSTTSLNCPISFKRIKTPIKGQLCKHRQCFDYDNYVDINSRRPSWRCPHCSQSVCFTDIRIDRIMVKVLNEVGVNVSHVKISADGSWEVVNEDDDHTDEPQSKPPLHQQSTCSQSLGPNVLDLTEDENYINATNPHQDIEKKPSPAQLQNQPNPNNQIPIRNTPPHMGNRFQRIHLPNVTSSNAIVPPVTNPITHGQSKYLTSNNTNGSYSGRGGHVTRIPIAVQALQAQTSTGPQQRLDGFHMPPHHMGPQQLSGYGYNLSHQVDQFNLQQHQLIQSNQMFHQQGVVGPTNGVVNVNNNNQQQAHHHHYATSAAQQGVQVSNWTPPLEQHGGQQGPRVSEENWRPSGRMRGSLSGQAYSDALNRFMYCPTQPLQATRPQFLNTPRPVIPPHLQHLFANNRNLFGSQGPENSLLFDNTNRGGGGGGFR